GSNVRLRVTLSGGHVVQPTTTHITPTQGHLHVFLDNKIIFMNYKLNAVIPNVRPGQHTLRVEFVASDHLPFDPRVFTGVVFEVKSCAWRAGPPGGRSPPRSPGRPCGPRRASRS